MLLDKKRAVGRLTAALVEHKIPPECLSIMHAPNLDPEPGFTATRARAGQGSDRYVTGTSTTLLRNAKILTGARNGTEVVYGDVLLDKGVVIAVGYIPEEQLVGLRNLDIVDTEGKWVSPGLVDAHSHLGVHPAPGLAGSADGNSHKAPILPWLRSIDGLNTHDDAYALARAGGVTTAQILPGSANNIGGQAFLIKTRQTPERSTSAMLLEPPHTLFLNSTTNPRENPNRRYSQTRMDAAWNFRNAYSEARKIKSAQDAFCAAAARGGWDGKAEFPQSLQWEALVDVLRGRVKLSVHCYEAVDLDALIRLSNEFEFPIASIHHAGETYLVPDLLKRAWGQLPVIALFASNFRKKREAYRGSEFAPRILADSRLPVIMKSDHPVLNSRYLVYEAQQAHYYSLNAGLAIASVTSTPAAALGVGWRVGTIAEDLVVWDSHPLALGATPVQVYIDGIPQLVGPAVTTKPEAFQHVPRTPNWDAEVRDTLKHEGLPPLSGRAAKGIIALLNVRDIWVRHGDGRITRASGAESVGNVTVVVRAGKIQCISPPHGACAAPIIAADTETIDLEGGSIAPGLTTFGSDLGLSEIMLEPSTNGGPVFDPLTMRVPTILGDAAVVRAVDGLQFGGRNALHAYRAGVTAAAVAPMGSGFLQGLGTAFRVGAGNAAQTALHVSLHSSMSASVSTQIAVLRRLLITSADAETGTWSRVKRGEIPLVIRVHNADIMASLLRLKSEWEELAKNQLRMTFAGATEAHLLAAEIAAAGVSVILFPARPYPGTWDTRRILPGPPLSGDTAVTALLKHRVNVGLGVMADYDARNARFEIAWAALDSNGTIDYPLAMALGSANLEKALGVVGSDATPDELVLCKGGGLFDFTSKVVGVMSERRGMVELF
ncbi:hypothetical protein C8J57DRAFT_1325544 [Mycena rebaudengoi]|nr:hypothetical protein C8J57DRAFT_1325544 [Mycena rebaudengoi]